MINITEQNELFNLIGTKLDEKVECLAIGGSAMMFYGAKTETKDVVEVDKDDIIVDIGPETVESFKEPIEFAGTIVWNGPLGIFEFENFKKGNDSVAELIADSGAFTLIGGGDTIAGLPKGLKEKYSYMSTAGGATLDFLAGKKLPGIEAVK